MALIDYRKKDAIEVETVDEEHFKITLKFFVELLDGTDENTDKDKLLKEWCAQWSEHEVAKEFQYVYDVLHRAWVSPGVFEMVIHNVNLDGTLYDTEESVKEAFLYESLEDGAYEGDNNFFVVPASQKRIAAD